MLLARMLDKTCLLLLMPDVCRIAQNNTILEA